MLKRIVNTLPVALALCAGAAHAQTTLGPGDIAFVTINTTSTTTGDSFTFLTLVPISSGTQIKFTDRGVHADGTFNNNCATVPPPCAAEQTATWTATSALAAGTLVTITSVTPTDGLGNPGVVTASTGSCDLALSFTSIGDSVTAYQGNDTTHTFLASLNMGASPNANGFSTTVNGTTSCALPPGLVAGTSAIGMFPNTTNAPFQNAQYDCSKGTSGSAATLRGWLNNRDNWFKQSTTLYGPINCSFTVQTAAVPQIAFAQSTLTVSEANNATITLNRSLVTNTATSIDVTFTAGSATGGGTDFTSTTQTVSFAANVTTATLTVPINNDALDEDNETFTMTLVANGSGAQPAAPFSATVTITDNDTSGLTISKSALAVTEGGATDSYTLTLNAQPTANVQLLVNVPDGQANVRTTGSYASNVNVVFTPSNWNTAQTVTVQAVDDAAIETSPHASSVQHSIALTSDSRYAPLTFPTSSISITDNDVAPSIYNFSAATYSVVEGNTAGFSTNGVVRVNRTGNTAIATTVNITLADGAAPSATGGVDYNATAITVSFAAGDTFKDVNIPVAGDAQAEGDERVALTLASPSNSGQIGTTQPTAVLTITNDDVAVISVAPTTVGVTEGGANANYAIVLTSQPTSNVIIVPTAGGADVTVSPSSLTFTPANWATAQTITVTAVDDSTVEGAESATITHLVATADAMYVALSAASVTADITDDDVTPAVYDFSAATYSVTEGDVAGFSVNAVVRVNRTANTAGATSVTVSLTAGAAPAATAGVDFNAAAITVSFADGETFKNINVPIAGDSIDEADEHIALSLSSPSNSGQIGTTHATATLTITDDDTAGITVTPTTLSVTEGGASATYSIVLTSQPTSNVSISATAGGSDVTANNTSLTFTPANWATAQTVTVSAVDDSAVEGAESATLTHAVTSADTAYSALTAASVAVTITDNDVTPAVYDFSAATSSVTEGNIAGFSVNAVLRVNRTGNTVGATSVTVSLAAGTAPAATAGVDFDAAPITVSFADGDTFKEFNVPIAGDFVAEGDEHIALSLGSPSNAGQIGTTHPTATLTITNDDTSGAAVAPSHVSIIEGGDAGTYSLVLTSQPTDDVTISVTSTMSELVSTPSTVTFTAANWNVPQPVSVTTADDAVIEATHTTTIDFAMTSNDPTFDGDGVPSVVVTVTDNDFPMPIYDFSAATFEVTEGAPVATIRVLRTSDTSLASTVAVTFANGAAPSATAGLDYDATTITVSFAANESVKDVTVPILDDSRHEPGEHVALSLANPSGLGQVGTTNPTANLTILDDDAVGVAVSLTTFSVSEGGAPASYTLVLSSMPASDVVVALATSSSDLSLSATTVTFTAADWNTPQSVTVTAVDDSEVESTENATITHTVTSADSDYDALAIADVTISVIDDDGNATLDKLLSFSAADAGAPIAASPGAKNVLALDALVQVPSSAGSTELTALSLSLSAASELAPPPGGRVFLVLDNDGDGAIGAGDTELGSTALDGKTGVVALTFSAPLTLTPGSQRRLLLAYDLPSFPLRAGLPLVLLLAAAALRRGRRRLLALGLFGALTLSNTGCMQATVEEPRSFELRAEVVGATATSGTTISGLPLKAATVTAKE